MGQLLAILVLIAILMPTKLFAMNSGIDFFLSIINDYKLVNNQKNKSYEINFTFMSLYPVL
jgi:hypothetical protein